MVWFFETYEQAYDQVEKLGGWMHYKIVTHYDDRRNCYEVVAA